MTPEQRAYLADSPLFVLQHNLDLGIYSDDFGKRVRLHIDVCRQVERTGPYDPLEQPPSEDETKARRGD